MYPKWGECILRNEKPKSFQSLKADLEPQPIMAQFTNATLPCFVSKNGQILLGSPLAKSWIHPCIHRRYFTSQFWPIIHLSKMIIIQSRDVKIFLV